VASFSRDQETECERSLAVVRAVISKSRRKLAPVVKADLMKVRLDGLPLHKLVRQDRGTLVEQCALEETPSHNLLGWGSWREANPVLTSRVFSVT
jgi:hypothetical protein